jgi:hypothetical protein
MCALGDNQAWEVTAACVLYGFRIEVSVQCAACDQVQKPDVTRDLLKPLLSADRAGVHHCSSATTLQCTLVQPPGLARQHMPHGLLADHRYDIPPLHRSWPRWKRPQRSPRHQYLPLSKTCMHYHPGTLESSEKQHLNLHGATPMLCHQACPCADEPRCVKPLHGGCCAAVACRFEGF